MIDLNYLGHTLVNISAEYLINDYDCKICGVEMFFDIKKNKYYFADYKCRGFLEVNITCEEQQIKNILE